MIKISLSLVFIFGLVSCKRSTESTNYLGQSSPDSIPVIFAPDIVSVKGRLEHGISFAPDTQEFAFGILNKDGIGEIYHSKKVDNNWTEPMLFEPLRNESVHLPYFSPNGKSLLYAQDKPNTNDGSTDIWIIEKNNESWGVPQKMQPPLSSTSREANASMTYDGTIYFSSNRNCLGKENCYSADLFYSKSIDNQYQNVEVISECNSPNDEESVFISPKEDYIIFCRYTDDTTWMDLYISYRDHNNIWLKPRILDSSINSKDWDRRPFVSIDNKFLFFTRLQIDEKGLTESDIYWVNTSKLFKPFVFNPITEKTVKIDKETELTIPSDYFKDIDDEKLEIRLNNENVEWAKFDNEKMTLIINPKEIGEFDLIFTAIDKFSNETNDRFKIIVEE